MLEQLQLRNVQKFKSSTYRANLYYDVIVRESLLPAKAETHMVQFIRKILFDSRERQKREGKQPEPASGIVYCQTKNECEEMVNVLQSGGIRAEVYHGGVSNKVFGDFIYNCDFYCQKREEVQRRWTVDEVPVVVATIAFGMGVDKASVRFGFRNFL